MNPKTKGNKPTAFQCKLSGTPRNNLRIPLLEKEATESVELETKGS